MILTPTVYHDAPGVGSWKSPGGLSPRVSRFARVFFARDDEIHSGATNQVSVTGPLVAAVNFVEGGPQLLRGGDDLDFDVAPNPVDVIVNKIAHEFELGIGVFHDNKIPAGTLFCEK